MRRVRTYVRINGIKLKVEIIFGKEMTRLWSLLVAPTLVNAMISSPVNARFSSRLSDIPMRIGHGFDIHRLIEGKSLLTATFTAGII